MKVNLAIKHTDEPDWTKCDSTKVANIRRKIKAVMLVDDDNEALNKVVGTYKVKYQVTDSSKETTIKEITVTVTQNQKPSINAKDKTINLNSTFNALDGVTTTDPETGAESTEAVTTWNGTTAKYWPIDSELDFVVYSPYQANDVAVTNTANSKKLEVTVATNATASLERQTDYMYGAEYYAGHDKEEASVPVNFKHALSLITVNFTGNANVKIVSAVLDNTAQDGTYTVQYLPVVDPAITWAPGNADNDLTLKPTTETALSGDAITTEYMVVPTAASSITISVALGTSTPTSITVVDTKILIFPSLNSAITRLFSSGFCFPWSKAEENSGRFF